MNAGERLGLLNIIWDFISPPAVCEEQTKEGNDCDADTADNTADDST